LTVVFSFDVWCSPEIAVCIIAHPMAWNADRSDSSFARWKDDVIRRLTI